MCPFYNGELFEITGTTKGVFTHSQSSCHIAKVVLTIRHDSRQIPIASDARPFHTSRGFLHWRVALPAPTVRPAPPSGGRHPQTFTRADITPSHRRRKRLAPAALRSALSRYFGRGCVAPSS